MTNGKRIVTLFTIISLAYVYSCYVGNLRNEIKPIKQKLIRNVQVKSVSILRYGFDFIKHIIAMSMFNVTKPLKELFRLFGGIPIKSNSYLHNIMSNF